MSISLEKKISRNLVILYRAKKALDASTLKKCIFLFSHNYLNYGNIAWSSTTRIKFKKMASNKKH